jgi:two-component system response regulator FixJ
MSDAPTVFVVDDDPAMRESLCWLIESVGLKVQPFASAGAFLNAYSDAAPGCVVLDVRMPGISGLELHAKLAEMGSTLPVLLITGHGDVPMAVRAMKSGAFDFFEKPFNDQALLERISQAIEQDSKARAARRQADAFAARLATLSTRERQVADRVVQGRLNKQIAMDLSLSEKTIETHRSNAMRKMGAASAVDLVRIMLEAAGKV